MATKKAAKKATKKAPVKKAAKKPAEKPRKMRARDPMHSMRLSGKMFLEYKAAMEALWHARKELELRELQLQVEMGKPEYAPLLKLQNQVNDALRSVAPAQTHFKQIQAKVAEKFSIDPRELYKYTINEYSGAMVFTPPREDDQAPTTSS